MPGTSGPRGVVSGTFEGAYRTSDTMNGRFTAEYCELPDKQLTCH